MANSSSSHAEAFRLIASDVCEADGMQLMKRFVQHGRTSTYQHCVRVARLCFRMNRALGLGANERALVRGALLHDYYLYDWHVTDNRKHAVNHPCLALENALRDFPDLTPRERNAIEAHMWPLPLTRVPRCREAWLVCVADKWCSLVETVRR